MVGDAAAGGWDGEFDLVIMTGHAIQVIVDLDEIKASLAAIRSALSGQGRFVFETRNPLARDWETWMPDQVWEFTAPDGTLMRKWHEITSVDGEIVSYKTTYTSPNWAEPVVFESSQRFIDRQLLSTLLLLLDYQVRLGFGDWNRQPLTDKSPEIITIARGD